jgi:hypothetical protein
MLFKFILVSTIFIFFIGNHNSVFANQWQSFGQHSGSEYFFDKNSISGTEAERLITIKRNYIEGNFAPMSQEYKYKVNCNSEEFTLVSINTFKEPDLRGDTVPSSTQNLNVARKSDPQKVSALYIKAACSKHTSTTTNQGSQQLSLPNTQNSADINKLKNLWIGHWSNTPEGCVEGAGLFIENGKNGNLNGRFMVKNHAGRVLENSKSTYKNFRLGNNSTLVFDTDRTFFNGNTESTANNQINITKAEFSYMVSGAVNYINCSNPNIKAQGAQNIKNAAAQDRLLFGLIDDFKTGLIDQSSAVRRLASCIGIMKGAQYAANSLSQQNLALSLAQQTSAFYSYGSSKFPSFSTIDRLMLDGAERDAQSGAEVLSRNNQQALVFKIANNCKGALGAAQKN